MLPLVALAASFVPELVKLIAGDKAGKVAGSVAQVVQDVTGTSDPAAAQAKLAADPAIAADLKVKLAQVAVEQTKAQNEEAENQRQAELESLRQSISNTESARTTMLGLEQGGSLIAWGAPVVSVVVTVGFFMFLIVMVVRGISSDPVSAQIINIAVGALTAAFATVVNFWLGSSQSSQNKDVTVRAMQNNQANQTSEVVRQLANVTSQVASRALPAAVSAIEPLMSTPAAAPTAVVVATPAPADDNFPRCLDVTLAQEGGFVDNPADPGGATNMGITLATLQAFRGSTVTVTVDDVKRLTKSEATEIYRANYWLPTRCNDLPRGVDLMVFDFGVNAGPRTSVKVLQRALGVTADGSIGPMTLKAVHDADAGALIPLLADGRMEYYQSLPTFATFGNGWTNRCRQVASAAKAMLG